MTTSLTCDAFAERLADYLEQELDGPVTAALERHAADCAQCGALLRDVREIVADAAALPVLAPERDLWSGIAARIETPVLPLDGAARRQGGPARRWWARPGIAAAALVAVTAGVTHLATREALRGPAAPAIGEQPVASRDGGSRDAAQSGELPVRIAQSGPATPVVAAAVVAAPAPPAIRSAGARSTSGAAVPGGSGTVQLVAYRAGELAALDSLYDREIARLREVLGARRAALDPATVAVLDRNMLVIDRAIRECREALAADPASRFLNQQLNDALETKIELLRTAATMPIGS